MAGKRAIAEEGRAEGRTEGRALVALAPRPAAAPPARPLADFLTQLLACEAHLPAYRARRRLDPEGAARVYGGSAAPFAPRGRVRGVL